LYSLQSIELNREAEENHGRHESWQLLYALKWLSLSLRKRVLLAAGKQSPCRQV
jgi:hypothetical protein